MSNIIKLLPDSIANQIAAGEVVQRPSSVIKECIENSIDANSKNIIILLEDGGKRNITIIDDGIGMSPMDARMCFERHATSKLSSSDDLFKIKTMGFRGEALASIAAVAQVELITRRSQDELATKIIIEGSLVKSQDVIPSNVGTTLHIKNLFFNIPARRNFLKSIEIEKRHVYNEIVRLTLAYTEIKFEVIHNGENIYHLLASNFRNRIIQLFKKNDGSGLIDLYENVNNITISGLIGSPLQAKKTRGEQFLYVNRRFIRNNYLHHAILSAYERMIPEGFTPFYIIFMDIDPSKIDVNVHPTKQEIKFEDENLIYNYFRAAVRHALSFHLETPKLDFEKDPNLQAQWENSNPSERQSGSSFTSKTNFRGEKEFYIENLNSWQNLYKNLPNLSHTFNPISKNLQEKMIFKSKIDENINIETHLILPKTINILNIVQLSEGHILVENESHIFILNLITVHKNILYHQFIDETSEANKIKKLSQQLLFPIQLYINQIEKSTISDFIKMLEDWGFELDINNQELNITATPHFFQEENKVKDFLEEILNDFMQCTDITQKNLILSAKIFAESHVTNMKQIISTEELNYIVKKLFTLPTPQYNFDGTKCYIVMSKIELYSQL